MIFRGVLLFAISAFNQLQDEGFIQQFYATSGPAYFILFEKGFGGIVSLDESGATVKSINFSTHDPGRLLTLGDVVSIYGEPTLVVPAPDPASDGVRLAFPDHRTIKRKDLSEFANG